VSQTDPKIRVLRRLVWIEEKRFRGFGCSECAWVFNASGSPTGNSFDEMMRNFELQPECLRGSPKEHQRRNLNLVSSWPFFELDPPSVDAVSA
jgi:hypothetical protein